MPWNPQNEEGILGQTIKTLSAAPRGAKLRSAGTSAAPERSAKLMKRGADSCWCETVVFPPSGANVMDFDPFGLSAPARFGGLSHRVLCEIGDRNGSTITHNLKRLASTKETPLMRAVKTGKKDLVQICLRYGADHMRRNNEDLSALGLAYLYDKRPMIDLFLATGAQPLSENPFAGINAK